MDIFDYAMQMEDSGFEYYQGLARAATAPGLKTIFTRLAEDERKHFDIFKALKEGGAVPDMVESSALGDARNVFQRLPRGDQALKGLTDALPAYKHAMELEAKSFRLYEEAAGQESNPEVRALLLKIAGEEHEHFNILENVYNFVNAPNLHLEWGEFSNLGEFRQFGRDGDD